MDRRLVRVDIHGHMDEVFGRADANLRATGDTGGGSGRTEFKEIEILAVAGQQVHLVDRQLLGVPVVRFPSVEHGQERTAPWTAQQRYHIYGSTSFRIIEARCILVSFG